MRIALLSYRSKPHCGGQGIYLRHLSRELTALGHSVEVFSGQPYPDLDPGVTLTKVPSLDLYREPDPFRVPKLREFRDRVDVEEFATMCAAGFPEPKTFSTRVARLLRERVDDFDVVHDNQVLGYGMLEIEKMGLPLVTTIHHPITFDRRIDIAQTRNLWRKFTLSRWYGFLRMQGRVARKARAIITPSEASKRDIAKDFGVDPARMQVILLGVDDGFVPPTKPRVPGRILAMASADAPMKGIATLLEAFAKLRTERDLELLLVTKPQAGGRTEQLIDKLSIKDSVQFVQRRQRGRAGRADGLRRGRLRPEPLRGLLAADRGADGLRYAAGRVPAPAPSPRWSAPTGSARTWSPPATWASSRPPWPGCSTTPSGGTRWGCAVGSGSRSCSAGAPWPPRSPRSTRRRSRPTAAEEERDRADR